MLYQREYNFQFLKNQLFFIVFYNIRQNHLYSGFTQHEKTVSFLYCTGEYMHNDGQTRYEVSKSLRKGSKNKCVRHVAYNLTIHVRHVQ